MKFKRANRRPLARGPRKRFGTRRGHTAPRLARHPSSARESPPVPGRSRLLTRDGQPDAVAVQDAAPRSPTPPRNRGRRISPRASRREATGLDPAPRRRRPSTPQRTGSGPVAPEDRPMTAGDVPPAGCVPRGRPATGNPHARPHVLGRGGLGARARPREAHSRPGTGDPPRAAVRLTPDDFGSPSNDPSRVPPSPAPAASWIQRRGPDAVFIPPRRLRTEDRPRIRPRRRPIRAPRTRPSGRRASRPAGAALPPFLCAAVGTAAAKCTGISTQRQPASFPRASHPQKAAVPSAARRPRRPRRSRRARAG